ncbi:hypothetical protein [Nocardia tengchongensis]|uniref:hypothetical protein n=1 Tax=Nocardia tengchongensis TaxID=2055889 RepID=UPI00368139E2
MTSTPIHRYATPDDLPPEVRDCIAWLLEDTHPREEDDFNQQLEFGPPEPGNGYLRTSTLHQWMGPHSPIETQPAPTQFVRTEPEHDPLLRRIRDA